MGRARFFLLACFGSGCAALIYEIVWFQLLQFAIGSSAVSIAVLLATFMGGMCLGSLFFSRFVPRRFHPLLVYAVLEIGVGALGVLITLGLPEFDVLYAALARTFGAGVTLRALICAACLLPPTLLMGATLPAISRWLEDGPSGVSWLGFFYAANTLGAVAGCLLAGFYLLRAFDIFTATYAAAALNLVVAAIGVGLYRAAPREAPPEEPRDALAPRAGETSADASIYVAIALSGAAALGAEVVWTRLLSLLLAGTTYTFSIILAVFLVGLGIGSSGGALLTRRRLDARTCFVGCQILGALSIGWAAWAVTNGLPNASAGPVASASLAARFWADLARCSWAILPPTLFWGASFPLALGAMIPARDRTSDPARVVGRVYAANTVGAIVGALFFGLVAVKTWGSQTSQHVLIALAGVAALVPLRRGFVRRPALLALLAVAVPVGAIAVLQVSGLDAVPWKLVAFGRNFHAWDAYDFRLVTMAEGANSSVAVTRSGNDTLNFHVSGKIEASTKPSDMRLQLMLGHYPAFLHPRPEKKKKVLIVGCGAGVTAGSFIPHKDVEKIVICEIEPLVPQVVAQHFGPQNNDVVTRKASGELVDPRVQIVYDDARHYIRTTDEKFDIITSDPIHPWVKGAANLYTKEYFDLVREHLEPGGLVTQWVPLYESSSAVVKSEIKTFFESFPTGTIWSNAVGSAGYDVILMGERGGGDPPLVIDEDVLLRNIATVLGQADPGFAVDMLGSFAGRASDLTEWTRDGEINYDRNLRLQYLAGESLDTREASRIQNEIVSYRKFPDGLIRASVSTRARIESAWKDERRP